MNQLDLRRHVEKLAATPRVPGTTEHVAACAYIQGRLESYGYATRRVVDPQSGAINVHAALGDPSNRRCVVGAHYDSVPLSPGADDNASGVAALLEVARACSSLEPGMHVEFVAYDLEENGLLGSLAHCRQLRGEKADVVAMLSLEMLGFTGERQIFVPGVVTTRQRGDFLAVVANSKSEHLLGMFQDVGTSPPTLPVERVVAPEGTQAAQLSQLSDHGSFWDHGWPALLVTDTAFLRNPHYHRATDRPDTLDYAFLAQSTEQVFQALRRFTTPLKTEG